MSKYQIHCVRTATVHNFEGNLLLEQFKLRYRILVCKLKWANIYEESGQEFDSFDNPSAEYFIATNSLGEVVGCLRSHPTTIPYMLSEKFSFLVVGKSQKSKEINELSRLVCDDELLSIEDSKLVTAMLFSASVERGLQRGIKAYVGFVEEAVGEKVFVRDKWELIRSSANCEYHGINLHGVILPVNIKTLDRMKSHLRTFNNKYGSIDLDFGAGFSSLFLECARYTTGTYGEKRGFFKALSLKAYTLYVIIKSRLLLSLGLCKSHSSIFDFDSQ